MACPGFVDQTEYGSIITPHPLVDRLDPFIPLCEKTRKKLKMLEESDFVYRMFARVIHN